MRDGEEVALVDIGLGSAVINVGCEGVEGGDVAVTFDGGGKDEGDKEGGERKEDDEEEGILDVAVGESHILALTTKGRVYAVGEGKWGQLGTGKRKFESEWVQVHVPILVGETGRDDDGALTVDIVDIVDNVAGVEETAQRPEWDASGEKISENPPEVGGDGKYHTGKKKIVGVECGLWSSFLLVSDVA